MERTITDYIGAIELTYDTETHQIEGYVDDSICKKITDEDFEIICKALKILYDVDIT